MLRGERGVERGKGGWVGYEGAQEGRRGYERARKGGGGWGGMMRSEDPLSFPCAALPPLIPRPLAGLIGGAVGVCLCLAPCAGASEAGIPSSCKAPPPLYHLALTPHDVQPPAA